MTWIQTSTGKAFELIKPSLAMVDIIDIARGLSHLCRYCGQVQKFYSVAQHSVVVSVQIEQAMLRQIGETRGSGTLKREQDAEITATAFWGLMHDAAEAYCGDMTAPVKQVLRACDDLEFDDMEARIMQVICRKFGMALKAPEIVHEYDLRVLATERRGMFLPGGRDWELPYGPLDVAILPWSSEEAYTKFLARFDELGGQR